MVVITKWDELTHWLRQIAREITGHVSAASYGDKNYLAVQVVVGGGAIAALTAQRAKGFKFQANDKDHAFSFGKKPVDKIQKIIACI